MDARTTRPGRTARRVRTVAAVAAVVVGTAGVPTALAATIEPPSTSAVEGSVELDVVDPEPVTEPELPEPESVAEPEVVEPVATEPARASEDQAPVDADPAPAEAPTTVQRTQDADGDPDEPRTVPSQPRSLAADPAWNGSAVISCDAPADPGTAEVQTYEVLMDGRQVGAVDAATRTLVVDGLTPGEHGAEVVAVNDHGPSPAASVTFTMPTLPSSPLSLTATQVDETSVLVAWEPPELEGETQVLGYRVTATPLGGGVPIIILSLGVAAGLQEADCDPEVLGARSCQVGADVRTHLFEDLEEGTAYRFGVAAYTADGVGDDETTTDVDVPAEETPDDQDPDVDGPDVETPDVETLT